MYSLNVLQNKLLSFVG